MLGRQSPQGKLFRPDHLYLQHVGEETFYGFLGRHRRRLFRDEDFAGLYRPRFGRPSVPPSLLCVALLLQARDGVSDQEAIERTAYDVRWKVALGLEMEDQLCAKSTLQLFRSKLVLHDQYQQIFETSIEACRKSGLLKRKKLEVAIDSTPVFGRGAVKDTFNLISDQIRKVVHEVVALKGYELEELVREHGLGRHFGKSLKGECELDWNDAEQKRALVGQLVADAGVALELSKSGLRGYAKGAEKTQKLREARDLLADLLLQDVEEEPEDGQGPQIRRGTSKDRIISTTDPEMRHGRKSPTKTIDGYKASVVVDTESGVILATDVKPANKQDGEGAAALVAEATERSGKELERVLGDTAYGNTESRRALEALGAEVVAKAPPAGKSKARFTVDDFHVDHEHGVATCPANKRSIRRNKGSEGGWRYVFSRKDCTGCPMRSDCTTSKVLARTITITDQTVELQRLRRRQKTKAFRRAYRRRIIAEHRIGRLVQLGIRHALYFGKSKGNFQVAMAATVANLVLVLFRPSFALSRLSTVASFLFWMLHILITLIRVGPPESAVSVTSLPEGTVAPVRVSVRAYSRPGF